MNRACMSLRLFCRERERDKPENVLFDVTLRPYRLVIYCDRLSYKADLPEPSEAVWTVLRAEETVTSRSFSCQSAISHPPPPCRITSRFIPSLQYRLVGLVCLPRVTTPSTEPRCVTASQRHYHGIPFMSSIFNSSPFSNKRQ